ncbi:hypothetical protein QP185_00235 [Sphingomonas aerolata]|uniref:hypothetical protein n=1 Tax=Sphingomonas aerolata TaxID=185951 RepID=UPI002FE06790
MLNRTMLFACSFRHFAEIADIAVACGWDAVVTATASGIDPAYVESGAPVVVIDARGAIAQGLAAAQTIAPGSPRMAGRCCSSCRAATVRRSTGCSSWGRRIS